MCSSIAAARPSCLPPHRHHLRGLWRGGRPSGSSRSTSSRASWRRRNGPAPEASPARQGAQPFLKDVYGCREILKRRRRPEDLVFQNPVFRLEMRQQVPHDIYVHIAGIDIVRADADTFYVLEDNARTPSGVSYMLENRESCCGCSPSCSRATASRRSTTIPTNCWPR